MRWRLLVQEILFDAFEILVECGGIEPDAVMTPMKWMGRSETMVKIVSLLEASDMGAQCGFRSLLIPREAFPSTFWGDFGRPLKWIAILLARSDGTAIWACEQLRIRGILGGVDEEHLKMLE
jgi:hypothetical protein